MPSIMGVIGYLHAIKDSGFYAYVIDEERAGSEKDNLKNKIKDTVNRLFGFIA